MSQLLIHAGDFTFQARFEEQLAPKTCAAFRKAMPFESQAIHMRWSGEGVGMPLGDLDFGVSYENHTSYPASGQIIRFPDGVSETEILLGGSFEDDQNLTVTPAATDFSMQLWLFTPFV